MAQQLDMIWITETEYKRLVEAQRKLNALECSGVDSWEGYGDAMESIAERVEEGVV